MGVRISAVDWVEGGTTIVYTAAHRVHRHRPHDSPTDERTRVLPRPRRSPIRPMTGFRLLAQFVGGSLGDRFNKRLLCVGCMIAHSVGLYLLTYADNLLMVGGFAMLHGIA